jgi:hypothetical protein
MSLLQTYLDEVAKYEMVDGNGVPSGKIAVDKVIELFQSFEVAMLNQCDDEQAEAILDRARSYQPDYL